MRGDDFNYVGTDGKKTLIRFKRLDFHRRTVTALAVNKEIILSGSQVRPVPKLRLRVI